MKNITNIFIEKIFYSKVNFTNKIIVNLKIKSFFCMNWKSTWWHYVYKFENIYIV
jgi:hypothetical protein